MSGPEATHPDLAALLQRCRVSSGKGFALAEHDPHPALPDGLDKTLAASLMPAGTARLRAAQELLYANATWSVLMVVQAMDAAGKDGTIEHVMTGVNPQGVTITSFKAPGPEDLAHDFLWRPTKALPARGMIGLFNRSHYEDVLVARVHPEVLANQRMPPGLTTAPGFWDGRLADIAAFEKHLGREGTRVVKLFLHVSRAEQKKRLLDRLAEPDKLWKFDASDVAERQHWAAYMDAYEAAITATATPDAPWYVIPADRKWLMRLLVMQVMVDTLTSLDLRPMTPGADAQARFAEAQRSLESEP